MKETFYGYRFTGEVEKPGSKATHDGRTVLQTLDEVHAYVADNVETFPEIRIVDAGDLTCVHVINREWLFPKSEDHGEHKLLWNPVEKRFDIVRTQ